MQHKYLLAICIPTYNREVYLKRLLDSIVTQKWFTDEICIIINDWPSKDNTTEMISEYQAKYGNIYYSRNDIAVWMLPAILESIEMSTGRYTWLFGSDDFMHSDALEIITETIKKQEPTLILSNRLNVNITEEASDYIENNSQILTFNWFSNFSEYFWVDDASKYQDKWNYLTFMSVFCFETEYYRQSLEYTQNSIIDMAALKKHYFNYIVILFSRLSVERVICIIEKPRLVFCQSANTSWEPNHKINQDIKMLMDYLKKNYSLTPWCIKIFKRMYFESFLYGTILYKLQKIHLFKIIMKRLTQNNTVKKIYYTLTKIVSWTI